MFNTILNTSKGEFSSKGSKFFSYLFPLRVEKDIKELLSQVEKLHPESKHICYAYRIGTDQIHELAHDAGEPGHSAGDPILYQLKSNNLTQVLGVVARIFGGTKLGIHGLREAYSLAIEDAIFKGGVVKFIKKCRIKISSSYTFERKILRIISLAEGKILEKTFDDRCHFEIEIPERHIMTMENSLNELVHEGLTFEIS